MKIQALVGLGLLLGLASPALAAMPVQSQTAGTDVVTVAGGCGPYWHRGPYGGCRHNYYAPRAYYYAPPPVVVVRPRPYWGHCWRGYYGHVHCN